jgi:DNA-binding NtrC family response regulator
MVVQKNPISISIHSNLFEEEDMPDDACSRCGTSYDFSNEREDAIVLFIKHPECNIVVAHCPKCEFITRIFCSTETLIALRRYYNLEVYFYPEAPEDIMLAQIRAFSTDDTPEEVEQMLAKSYQEIVAHLNKKVIGQPRAIRQLERALKIAQAGLGDGDKPLGVFLFAGPTGTGKSEMVRALAEAIHDDPEALCRVDCNLLTESHTAASIMGSPPGYVGSDKSDTLLNKKVIEGKPGRPGILVFEEIEKAHPRVYDTLLGIFDKATLQLNNGRQFPSPTLLSL